MTETGIRHDPGRADWAGGSNGDRARGSRTCSAPPRARSWSSASSRSWSRRRRRPDDARRGVHPHPDRGRTRARDPRAGTAAVGVRHRHRARGAAAVVLRLLRRRRRRPGRDPRGLPPDAGSYSLLYLLSLDQGPRRLPRRRAARVRQLGAFEVGEQLDTSCRSRRLTTRPAPPLRRLPQPRVHEPDDTTDSTATGAGHRAGVPRRRGRARPQALRGCGHAVRRGGRGRDARGRDRARRQRQRAARRRCSRSAPARWSGWSAAR